MNRVPRWLRLGVPDEHVHQHLYARFPRVTARAIFTTYLDTKAHFITAAEAIRWMEEQRARLAMEDS